MTIAEMEAELDQRGYWLRDDGDIRDGVESFKGIEEAYSLFRRGDGRVHVFGGPKCWAIKEAHKLVFDEPWRMYD